MGGERAGETNFRERSGRGRDKFARGEKREWERQICERGEGERERGINLYERRGRGKFVREERKREGQICARGEEGVGETNL